MKRDWVVETLPCRMVADVIIQFLDYAATLPLTEWELEFCVGIASCAKSADENKLVLTFKQWRSLVELAHDIEWPHGIVCVQIFAGAGKE